MAQKSARLFDQLRTHAGAAWQDFVAHPFVLGLAELVPCVGPRRPVAETPPSLARARLQARLMSSFAIYRSEARPDPVKSGRFLQH